MINVETDPVSDLIAMRITFSFDFRESILNDKEQQEIFKNWIGHKVLESLLSFEE